MFRKSKMLNLFALATFLSFACIPQYGYSLPQGQNVVEGNAEFTVNGKVMDIDVTTDKLIAEYQSFSVGSPEAVNFHQLSKSSVALNRVIGNNPSNIFGSLTANGRIFLVNPNGVLFGPNSCVDTAGLVASTLNIDNDDFLAGRYTFYGQGGTVANQGYISSPGGYVSLLGNSVRNEGVIEANLGSVALAAGERITLELDPEGLISVVVDESTTENLEGADSAVENTGTIEAEGGRVVLTAKALGGVFDKAVNNEGIIEAKSLVDNKGEVILIAEGENSVTANTGTIDVSADEEGADGGFVELSADSVMVDGTIDVSSAFGKAGSLLIDPWNFYILSYNPWWGSSEDGDDYVDFFEGGFNSYMTESWMESFAGNISIESLNNIYFKLGEEWGVWSGWVDAPGHGSNEILELLGSQFSLKAGNSILLGDDTVEMVNGGDIDFRALANSIDLGTGDGLISHGGDINLKALNDLILSAPIDAGAGGVDIETTFGGIDDDNAYRDIIADKLEVSSAYFGTSGNFIDTKVNELVLNTLGDIYVSNINPVGGVLFASAVESLLGKVKIRTNRDMRVGDIRALAKAVLRAGTSGVGSILDDNEDSTYVAADNINLKSAGGIGGTTATDDMSSGYLDIALRAGDLSLESQGDIYLHEVEAANFLTSRVAAVNTPADIDIFLINSAGDVSVDNTINTDVNLLLAAHNINADSDIITSADDLSLIALDNVNVAGNLNSEDFIELTADFRSDYLGLGGDGIGAVSQSGGLIGSGSEDLRLAAAQGIGSGSPLHTQVISLAAVNSDVNSIEIDNLGSLNIVGDGVENKATGEKVDLTLHSDLTVEDDSKIITDGGDINLDADGNIYVNNISTDGIFAGTPAGLTGDVTITAGGNIEDNYDSGNIPEEYDISGDNIVLDATNISSGINAPIEIRSNGLDIVSSGDVSLFHKGELDFGGFTGNSFTFVNSGDLYIDGVITTAGGGIDISVIEDPDLYLGALLSDPNNITLAANDGAIIDNNGSDKNIETNSLVLSAKHGIGSGNALETEAANLQAENAGSGNIKIDNTGDLNIFGSGVYNHAIGGNVDLSVASSLWIVDAPVFAGGSINLIASGVDGDIITGGYLWPAVESFNGNVVMDASRDILIGYNGYGDVYSRAGPGGISLTAGNDIRVSRGTWVFSDTGQIEFNAANDIGVLQNSWVDSGTGEILFTSGNDITVADRSRLISNAGDIDLSAVNNVDLGYVATGADVEVTADSDATGTGAITDNKGNSINIIADDLNLYSAEGIGSGSILEIAVDVLNAENTTSGNIEIDNTGNLFAESVINDGADIKINVHSDLSLGTVQAAGNTVELTADGAITDGDDTQVDILSNAAVLSAVKGIGSGNALETEISSLQATNTHSGDIELDNQGDLDLVDLESLGYAVQNAGAGTIEITAHSALTVTDTVSANGGKIYLEGDYVNQRGDITNTGAGNIYVKATTGDIIMGPAALTQAGAGLINYYALSDVMLAKLSTSGNVEVTADNGAIMKNNSYNFSALNIIGDKATLDAAKGIGHGLPKYTLQTKINTLNAVSAQSPYDIQVENEGDLFAENVASAGDVHLTVNSDLNIGYIAGTDVNLLANTGGIYENTNDANVNISAENLFMEAVSGIGAESSRLDTDVDVIKQAYVDNGDIYLRELDGVTLEDIQAKTITTVHGSIIDIITGGDTLVNNIQVSGPAGMDALDEAIFLKLTDGDLTIDGEVTANCGGSGDVLVSLLAEDGRIELLNNSKALATSSTLSDVMILLSADDNINTSLDSEVSVTGGDLAAIVTLAGGAIDAQGEFRADSPAGFAGVLMGAIGDVYANDVAATGGIDLISELENFIGGVNIEIPLTLGSGILLGSVEGNITLGDLAADVILAAALGLDGDSSIIDAGLVSGRLLGMVARNDIGESLVPVDTSVDILGAYSWDEGDIYVNEADTVELGGFFPVLDTSTGLPVFTLGVSVAANNGLVNIVSGDDMVVNSIVSPRGGVFLEALGNVDPVTGDIINPASIFAGDGWCPGLSQADLDNLLSSMPSFIQSLQPEIEEALMDMSSWGVSGLDYFSPVMAGLPDLQPGPNVFAGGYSYFSAPTGMIGVGTAGQDLTDPTVMPDVNPLNVCIQALNPANDATPAGFTPSAGLTLNMGGSSAYTGGGILGISGDIEGIVRPAVVAATGVYPSPDIDNTSLLPLNPPGFVYYNDTDLGGCCSALIPPAAANIGPQRIWPPYAIPTILATYLRAYYAVINPVRLISAYSYAGAGSQILTAYAYHPLTETDESAFDEISLDIGAYEFIEQNINLKKSLSPYFGSGEEEEEEEAEAEAQT